MYPYTRLRRTRKFGWFREIIAENSLSSSDFILPVFIVEGRDIKDPIESLPGVYRYSIDQAEIFIKEAASYGIKAIALFPSIDKDLKDEKGSEAYNLDNLICRSVRHIKNLGIDIGIICDVALDPYTSHGHDGIIYNDQIDNDKTIDAIKNQALVLAKAGADIVAPSDMMDGRVEAIRETLEENGFNDVAIISYAAKYASAFYSPFRDAVGSSSMLKTDKKTYQMDIRNSVEAIREVELDISEGADIVMIKPGLHYLDIIKEISSQFNIPVFAYHVSGEYAMLKFVSEKTAIDYNLALIETMIAFKRAGARAIFTYAALEVAKLLKN